MAEQKLDRDRFRGALLGLAVGDAVGTAVEFKPPGTFKPVSDMTGGGPFGLPAGAWTDDTSMALCLAESLVESGGFDPVDQLKRYVHWYREGHWSSTGRCFDIGNATRSALHRFERTGEPYPGDADPNAAGNGPLMKLAPVPMAFALHPDAAVEFAGDSARTTHGAAEAVDAARYFAGLLVGALRGATVSALLHQGVFTPGSGTWTEKPLHPKVLAVASGSFHAKEPPAIRGTGYIIGALEAALWALRSTRTFEDGVLAAANLGDDADTTAAIYGQLAGAIYGVDAIPQRWREQVVMREEILALADRLYDLARSVDGSAPPVIDRAPVSTPPELEPTSTPGDSYWVVPGKILAGPYPGAPSKSAARTKLEAFVDLGVTCFLDLTEEGEGPPLHPYAMLLRRVASSRKRRITYLRMPIRDVDIPTSWQMRAILGTLRAALGEGETVYIHCWGGVGRTGTVVGCYLREEGVPASDVLGKLAAMRTHTDRANRTSPETEAQRTFVTVWESSGALVLDQQALDQLQIEPVVVDATPVPSLGEVASALSAGRASPRTEGTYSSSYDPPDRAMTTLLRFELDGRAADRVIDLAFGENRARIESSGEGFNSYSIACGLVGDDAGEAMTLAQVICCIAYHCFIDDDNLRRPPGCQFHKALLAAVVGSWDSEPGVAAEVHHHAALALPLIGQPRVAEWIYPEVEDRWEASRDALQRALEQLVEMGNEILPVMTAYAARSSP